jgi:hypothetical protein
MPDVVIFARDADRAWHAITQHFGAKLNNRDTNWGVALTWNNASPTFPPPNASAIQNPPCNWA